MGGLRFSKGLQYAALVATQVIGESQTVAANAMLVSGRSWRAPEDAQAQRSLVARRAMISNPHVHQLGVALVTFRNQTDEEQRVAFLEVGEDTELLQG